MTEKEIEKLKAELEFRTRSRRELWDALNGLLAEYEAMNSELRKIGKGRPDDGAHPDSPAQVARQALSF